MPFRSHPHRLPGAHRLVHRVGDALDHPRLLERRLRRCAGADGRGGAGQRDEVDQVAPIFACHLAAMAATVGIDADALLAAFPVGDEDEGFEYNAGARRSGHTETEYDAGVFNFHECLVYTGLYDGCVCFSNANGGYLVQEGEQNEAWVDIAIEWSPHPWFEAVWVDPDPQRPYTYPSISVEWYAPDD